MSWIGECQLCGIEYSIRTSVGGRCYMCPSCATDRNV
jgi:hypothetical protein